MVLLTREPVDIVVVEDKLVLDVDSGLDEVAVLETSVGG